MTLDRQALWDLFTLREEHAPWITDKYGRVPSWATARHDLFQPVVSEHLVQRGFKPTYPEGREFAVCLSHDIDLLFTPFRSRLAKAAPLGARALLGVLGGVMQRGIDPRYDLDNVLRAERKHNATSSFYFLSLPKGEDGYNYDPGSIGEQLSAVKQAGCEIGLHGGHSAWHDGTHLQEEKQRLERAADATVTGYRNHFLRFALPDTWKLLAQHGFTHDSTLAYSDRAGFRNGMCHPFRPYDHTSGGYLDIMELPLAIMDAGLFVNMKLDRTTAMDLCKRMIARVKQCNGVLTLLWHNNYFQGDMGRFYDELLGHLKNEGAWLTSSASLLEHWQAVGNAVRLESTLAEHLKP
ncbi:MAG: polysaccharide deacetylase family protein [Flavobacteriales bacterium]